jgi:aryl-alcohol dehydrogenase-like predicted oxidoreductase
MRPIPATGEMIPAIGLGTFETFDITPGEPRGHVREVIRLFHEPGGRVIDTSPLYGMSEVNVGDFIIDLGIVDDIFITNKTWTTGDHLSDRRLSNRELNDRGRHRGAGGPALSRAHRPVWRSGHDRQPRWELGSRVRLGRRRPPQLHY